MSLKNFLAEKFEITNFDNDYVQEWNKRSFFAQMMDVWGEMNYALKAYDDEDNKFTASKALMDHISAFHDVCCLVYSNPNVHPEEKDTLKFAEWEFLSYVLWGSNDKSFVKWFDQWNNDINYDLL